MPHYILDARTATPHFPGIGRYVTNLARALVPLLTPDERLTMLYDPRYPISLPLSEAVSAIPLAVSPFSLRQQWIIPHLLRSFQLPASSVYHSPYIAMPYQPGVPALLTVYDLIPLRYPAHSTARARLLIRWMTRLALRTAKHVIAISEFTRRDFMAEFGLQPERITAVPLAADPAFSPQPPEAVAAVRARYALPERFVLYLGSNKPHKNLVRLVEAWQMANGKWQMANSKWQIADSRLVIAGAWDARYPEARERANALTTTDPASSFQVPVWLGPVPEADLPALYSAATVFVFPSLYEGFGLPVLEAMACGTPVICSNTSSLPEVTSPPSPLSYQERGIYSPLPSQGRGAGGVGDCFTEQAALLIDPLDTAALADAIRRVLSDDGLRAELRRRGLAQKAKFSWARTAQATLVVYRQLAMGQA
jgi:alpha-1,3-rhamnosyl/mannosyltransferase